jgi:hypothetical protein
LVFRKTPIPFAESWRKSQKTVIKTSNPQIEQNMSASGFVQEQSLANKNLHLNFKEM